MLWLVFGCVMLCCVLNGVVLVCCMYVLLVGLMLVVGRLCVVGVCLCWYDECMVCWLLVVVVVLLWLLLLLFGGCMCCLLLLCGCLVLLWMIVVMLCCRLRLLFVV